MKKIKKLLALTVTGLMMSGLSFAMPQNTTTASAGIVHSKILDDNAKVMPMQLSGANYRQIIELRTKDPRTGAKDTAKLMIKAYGNGYLDMEIFEYPVDGHVFDDTYAFIGLIGWGGPRLKWTTNFYTKGSVTAELQCLVDYFNQVKFGRFNTITMIGKDSADSVKWSTRRGTSAFVGSLSYDYGKGFGSDWYKYTYLFKVDNDGLHEMQLRWGTKDLFRWP